MSRDKRQFIHEYSKFFSCSSIAYDEEPKKNVVVTAQRSMVGRGCGGDRSAAHGCGGVVVATAQQDVGGGVVVVAAQRGTVVGAGW